MAQVTIYHDADVTVTVKPGSAPADQSGEVAQLTQDLATANQTIAQFKAFRDAVVADANARNAADAAKTDGQDVLDAATGLPA
jgi:hypothetical protein